MTEAYIVAATRTAGGRRNGALAGWHPADLGGKILDALVEKSKVDPAAIEDVILGCVSQVAEQSFHIGRNAVLASNLPDSVPAVSIDRQCGSSQQALQFAAQAVMSGTQDVVIAAGIESMSRVPMMSPTRLGQEAGLGTPFSGKIRNRYGVEQFSQFDGAELMAKKYGFSRQELDEYALESHRRASKATREKAFREEILPIEITDGAGQVKWHIEDEGIRHDASMESIGSVKLLREGGVITAANASQVCDGASGVIVASERAMKEHDLKPLARIHSLHVSAGDPVLMLEEPIPATKRALKKAGLKIGDMDLYEVNEAFAPVPLAWLRELGADFEKLNAYGGGISLGHPLGASGTKLMTTLVHALHRSGKRFGLQTMCEAGGIANVTIVERV
ncbi:MAG: acetyl-CoA C-acetyltransferase [Bradyrhizobium sp.]|uniref:acetyl-CoA C-acetyltransferase n=1 Tax=Bradyrhizobium sp. TaxID=376 RepID=UPI001D827753|nr:acetyl-CoA C-acetyltransferase [Bradyrhizobium sp.]MBV9560379.1 acetyl-CoA C-acetyltransferase [Bradyrhizobium sp.]